MADLVIRGMEMPKGNNAISIIILSNGKVCLAHDKKYAECAEAVPLPEGHGRLIDADAVMEIIRAHDYPLTAHFNSTDNGMFTLGIQQAVNEVPTIVPAEGGTENAP